MFTILCERGFFIVQRKYIFAILLFACSTLFKFIHLLKHILIDDGNANVRLGVKCSRIIRKTSYYHSISINSCIR